MEGKEALLEFVRSQKSGLRRVPIPLSVRARIRCVQSYLIEAATTNREMSLHCLTTREGNIMCRYHQGITKKSQAKDGDNTGDKIGEFAVTGIPGPRILFPNIPKKGMLNCGCDEEEVLTDFFFWKTWTITSPATKKTEGWKEQCLDPRARSFVVQAFQQQSGLKVDDLYRQNRTADEQRKFELEKELAIIQELLAEFPAENQEEESLLE